MLMTKKISIHAPAKGATLSIFPFSISNNISIHAPAKGATSKHAPTNAYSKISIHAPPKGATEIPGRNRSRAKYFNPRTREGCDKSKAPRFMASSIFQSTHPRRVRLKVPGVADYDDLFQSTHPRRVRRSSAPPFSGFPLFQSTHPRRVRPNSSTRILYHL